MDYESLSPAIGLISESLAKSQQMVPSNERINNQKFSIECQKYFIDFLFAQITLETHYKIV